MRQSTTWSEPRRARGMVATLAALALAGAAVVPASAQTRVPTTVGEGIAAPKPVVADGEMRLSLEDAVEIALRQNLDLSVQRFDRSESLFRVDQNRGIFDLRGVLSSSVSKRDSPNTTQLEGAAVLSTDSRDLSLRLDQLTPIGGTASFGLFTDRTATNSTNALINPEFGASQSLQYSQPLLRGFGSEATRRPILLAKISSGINREVFEQEVTRVTQQVENAYWGLVEAREQLVVAQESLKLARELDSRNQVQVDVGTLAPIELVQSEATVATREEEIIRAEAAVQDAADTLRQLLNLDRGAYWDLAVLPTTDPVTERIEVDLDAAIATALSNRPELRVEQLNLESAELDARFYRRERLPQVDLTTSYGAIGTAGRGRIFDPGTGQTVSVDTDVFDALDDAVNRRFDNWSIGIDVSYPLQNRSARAQAQIAELAVDRAQAVIERQRLQVITEVRTAARGVKTAAQQIESAKISRRLQERNLEAEQKRYENGMSTSFQVTQIQDDLTQARSREVSAITGYRRALAEYYRATGRLLEVYNVELVDSEAAATAAAASEPEAASGETPATATPDTASAGS